MILASVAAGAYIKRDASQTSTNNSTTTGENGMLTTPKPSITPAPTPSPTSNPPTSPTSAPVVTPAPTSLLPDDCRINYQGSINYDNVANVTLVTLDLEVLPDFSTRRSFILYYQNFYLTDNGKNITALMDANGEGEGVLLNENDRQTATITLRVTGNYTGNSYELAYNNPPDIILVWKKL